MLNRSLVKLGTLNKEEKETQWANSVSGSQAWLLINEPYNLIRDKLGLERLHTSQHDYINSRGFREQYGNSAMAQGIMYEETVLKELKGHFPNEELIYEDTTFKLILFDNETKLEHINITSTPDYFIVDNNGGYKLIGDIKCSSSADKEEVMMERYYYQALHNSYVLNCTPNFEIDAKNNITSPVHRYVLQFTQQDFQEYETKLIEFFTNLLFKNETAYDYMFEQKQHAKKVGKNLKIKPLVDYEASGNECDVLERLLQLKDQEKLIKQEIATIEQEYKTNYDNLQIRFNGKLFEIKAIEQKGTIDYTKAFKSITSKYNIPMEEFDAFRKKATLRKTISFK